MFFEVIKEVCWKDDDETVCSVRLIKCEDAKFIVDLNKILISNGDFVFSSTCEHATLAAAEEEFLYYEQEK